MIAFLFSLLFFISPFIFLSVTSELFEFNKIIFVYLFTVLITATWIVRCIYYKKIIFIKTPLDIPLVLFLLSQFVSTIISIDPITSIFGYYSRFNGGLLSTICYLILYWAYVSNVDSKKVLFHTKIILLSGSLIGLWAILEHFGYSFSCLVITNQFDATCWIQDVKDRVFASFGQPNWLAAWIVSIAPLGLAFILTSKTKKYLPHLLSVILFSSLIFTKSRSGILGFLGGYLTFWGLAFYKLKRKILISFILASSYLILIATFFGTPWTPPLGETRSQTIRGEETVETRQIVWKGAIKVWENSPILGTGVETFGYSYYKFRPVEQNHTFEWDYIYNKAHNEFLNILANSGIIGLFTYLLIIGIFVFSSLRNLKNKNYIYLISFLSGFVALNIAVFAGFLTVNTSLMFFILPAFSYTLINKTNLKLTKKVYAFQKLLYLTTIIIGIYLLILVGLYWYADVLYKNGRDANAKQNYNNAQLQLIKALKIAPFFANYHDQIAISYAGLSNSEQALYHLNSAKLLSPQNVNLAKSRANILSSIDLDLAINTLDELVILAPTDPSVYYIYGLTLAVNNKFDESGKFLEKAISLKPDYTQAVEALSVVRYNLEHGD